MTVAFIVAILSPLRADDVRDRGLELMPHRLSVTPSRFAAVRGIPVSGVAAGAARLSYLDRPLSVLAPGPEPSGTRSQVVAGALAMEMAMSRYWPSGFDVGLNLGAHVYQFGDGLSGISGEEERLSTFGSLDPMIEGGYRFTLARTEFRGFGAIYLPLGSRSAFAGEQYPRGEAGFIFSQFFERIEWGAELSLLYRPTVDWSTATWGTQLKFSAAARLHVTRSLLVGPEFIIRPILTQQPAGTHTSLIPGSALICVDYRQRYWQLGAHFGLGLPISRIAEDLSKQEYFRAPTTPVSYGSLTFQVWLL